MTPEEKEQLYNRLNKVDTNITRILFILESDNKINNKGLVETVQDNKRTIDNLLLEKKIENAKNGVWGVVGGAIATVIFTIIKFFIESK